MISLNQINALQFVVEIVFVHNKIYQIHLLRLFIFVYSMALISWNDHKLLAEAPIMFMLLSVFFNFCNSIQILTKDKEPVIKILKGFTLLSKKSQIKVGAKCHKKLETQQTWYFISSSGDKYFETFFCRHISVVATLNTNRVISAEQNKYRVKCQPKRWKKKKVLNL